MRGLPLEIFFVVPLETFVLSLQDVNLLILKGAIPRTVSSCISITNIWWLPTPKPADMMQECVITMSSITHTPSMGLDPQKKSGTKSFSCKVTNLFRQMESVFVGECLANGLLIYILVGVKAYNKSIPHVSPFLQLLDEILSEALSRARKVFFVCNKVPVVLLICCSAI